MLRENTGRLTATDGRYRALFDVSSAIAEQPTVKAVLHSLCGVLSSTSRLQGTELYVLDEDGESLHIEFDRDADAPAIKTGTRVSVIGAAARVLEEQKPVFIPDTSQEMLKTALVPGVPGPFASRDSRSRFVLSLAEPNKEAQLTSDSPTAVHSVCFTASFTVLWRSGVEWWSSVS